jgi:hypothetical protein
MITRKIDKDNQTAIGQGDPVKMLDTGYIAQWTATTGVSQLVGIFAGCEYLSVSFGYKRWSPYWPGSDAADDVTAFVVPCILAPTPQFIVQATLTPFTFADIGANVDVSLGTVNVRTGLSGATLNRATIGTDGTLPFRVVGLYSDISAKGAPGSDNTANYNWVVVAANVTGSTGLN